MKVIIAGSRTLCCNQDGAVSENGIEAIDILVSGSGFDVTEVVCGMAKGIDLAGRAWALRNGIAVKEMPADWKQYGKMAGAIRNAEMANYGDALIVLWDGKSRGTENMINCMKHRKKPIYQ